MDRDGMVSPLPRLPAMKAVGFLHWCAAVAALAAFLGAPLGADAQTVIGGTGPDVQVDLSVLDSLGPQPTLPERLRRQLPTVRTSLATPPATQSGHSATLQAPKAASKSKRSSADHTAAKKSKTKPATHAVAAVKPTASPTSSVAAPAPPPPAPPANAPTPPESERVAPTQATAPAVAAPPPAQPLPGPRVATAAGMAAATTAPSAAPANPPAAASTPAVAAATATPAPSLPAPVVVPAAAPAAVAPAAGGSGRIIFAAGTADLPDGARNGLDALAQRLTANPQIRLQLVAYASGAPEEASEARRVSLMRALAVRSYLIEHGVPNARMDVRALGNRSDGGGPSDRVDLVLLDR